jgi:hypothetical protein
MSACEKCWRDSQGYLVPYSQLLKERAGDHACTPEQQAGESATQCPSCKRMTLHQYTGEPMCGCEAVSVFSTEKP